MPAAVIVDDGVELHRAIERKRIWYRLLAQVVVLDGQDRWGSRIDMKSLGLGRDKEWLAGKRHAGRVLDAEADRRGMAVSDFDVRVRRTGRIASVQAHLPLKPAIAVLARRQDNCLVSHISPYL